MGEDGGPALLVTADPRLREEVARLAAAAALRLEVITAVDDTLHRWAAAGVVGDAIVAVLIAAAVLELFGCDSMNRSKQKPVCP